MKKIVLKAYGKILTFLLTLFGITNCVSVEYGTPDADFIIRGKVKDAETFQSIPKIGIIRSLGYSEEYFDTTYTNASGEYEFKYGGFPEFDGEIMVIAKDLDGEENGLYKADTLKIRFTNKDLVKKGKGEWYQGVYEKSEQNFALEREIPKVYPMYGVFPTSYKEKEK